MHPIAAAFGEFHFGRPQLYAALLLLAFLGQGLWLIEQRLSSDTEKREALAGVTYWRTLPHIAEERAKPAELVSSLPLIAAYGRKAQAMWPGSPLARLPFLGFGVWLGGGLWWVARRLYGNAGGYIALTLYCFSLPMLWAATTVGPEMIAAWGTFGAVFTAIGVAHTLYAPPRRWWPRVIILALGIGLAAAAEPASLIVVPLGLGFMLYLAPGRRLASLGIMTVATALAALVAWFATGFTWWPIWQGVAFPGTQKAMGFAFVLTLFSFDRLLLLVALVTYIVWRRSRYFGNTAPLLAAVFFLPFSGAMSAPFLCVFIGGMFADLLETKQTERVRVATTVLLGANAVLAVVAANHSLRILQ